MVFLVLLGMLLYADLLYILLWSFYYPLCALFFLLTHHFCPCVNSRFKSLCGEIGSTWFGNSY